MPPSSAVSATTASPSSRRRSSLADWDQADKTFFFRYGVAKLERFVFIFSGLSNFIREPRNFS